MANDVVESVLEREYVANDVESWQEYVANDVVKSFDDHKVLANDVVESLYQHYYVVNGTDFFDDVANDVVESFV